MGKQIISGEVIVMGDLDCVELIEEGCLIISEELTALTINKLINRKSYPCMNNFDILVTGEDGKDARPESGAKGGDGGNGGAIEIRVGDLQGDVHIKASGGNGGAGGTGSDGTDGGDGGDGGDGAVIDFYYDREDPESTSYAYFYSANGGMGGFGGNGGICAGGRGGYCGQKGTKGGRSGDGGNGGAMGKDGKITIHHPDGGVSVNGIECGTEEMELSAEGYRILDLTNDRDLRCFIQAYGGEAHLKNYPQIWSAVNKVRGTGGAADRVRVANAGSQYMFETVMSQVMQIGVASGVNSQCKADVLEKANEEYKFYKFAVPIQSFYYNSPPIVSEADGEASQPRMMGCIVRLELKDKNSGTSYQKMTRFYEEGVEHMLLEIETEEMPREELAGRELVMEAHISYIDQDQNLFPLEPLRRDFRFQSEGGDSLISKITVKDPHWHEGKTSGTVKFLYGRTPANNPGLLQDADYWDQDGPYHHNYYNGMLRTIIPISGDIELQDMKIGGATVAEVTGAKMGSFAGNGRTRVKPSELYYMLNNDKFTFAKYRSDIPIDELGAKLQQNGALTYDASEKTAHFDLKLPVGQGLSEYDWYSDISGVFLDQSMHKCYLSGRFVLEVEHKEFIGNTTETYEISIYGNDNFPDSQTEFYVRTNASTVYIPPIEIYWGCFAKDTLIRTADGSIKPACLIAAGDRIPALGGKILTVAEILTGEDTEIIRIVTKDGRRTRVSGGHAMLAIDEAAPAGRRAAAGQLQAGDRLMTPDGVSVISEVVAEPYNDMVYNFVFEGEETPNYIEADGFWSGDFYAQNEKKKTEPAQLTKEAMALRDELREFAGS